MDWERLSTRGAAAREQAARERQRAAALRWAALRLRENAIDACDRAARLRGPRTEQKAELQLQMGSTRICAMETPDARALVLETLLLEAVESAQMAICVYDDHGRYVTVNECACAILGYGRDELLKHDVGDFTQGGIDRNVLLSDQHREGVRLVERRDGSTVPCAFVVTPTRVAGLPYFVAVWWTLDDDDPRAAEAT